MVSTSTFKSNYIATFIYSWQLLRERLYLGDITMNEQIILSNLHDLLFRNKNNPTLRNCTVRILNYDFIKLVIPEYILNYNGEYDWSKIWGKCYSKTNFSKLWNGHPTNAFVNQLNTLLSKNTYLIDEIQMLMEKLWDDFDGDIDILKKCIESNKGFDEIPEWKKYIELDDFEPKRILTFFLLYSIMGVPATYMYKPTEIYERNESQMQTDIYGDMGPIKMHMDKWIKNAYNNLSDKSKDALHEYAKFCYRKNFYISSFVISNQQRSLLELYQPLTITLYSNKTKKFKIVGNIGFLENYKRVLLVDTAGMGKTTLVKYLTIKILLSSELMYIPIIIELRNLEKYNIINFIKKQMDYFSKEINVRDLETLIVKGGFLIFFDGYDEIEEEFKTGITNKINELVHKAPNNLYMITSREDVGLYHFAEFQRFEINNLESDEVNELIEKLDQDKTLSKYIIQQIEQEKNYKTIKELLGNPLLVSLLYQTFAVGGYGVHIPYKKSDFYNQIFYALFQKHDRTKDPMYEHKKMSGLDSTDFQIILRRFSFMCLQNDGLIEYQVDTVLNLLGDAINNIHWLKTDKKAFLHDLTHAVPYLEDYNFNIKWVHKSFMEYFASAYICFDTQDTPTIFGLLEKNVLKYYNVLDFCYDLNIRAFRRDIILPFLEKYIKECDYNNKNQNIRIEDFDLRQSLYYQYSLSLTTIEDDIVDKIAKYDLSEKEVLKILYKDYDRKSLLYKLYLNQQILVLGSKNKDNCAFLDFLYDKKVDIFYVLKKYTKIIYPKLNLSNRQNYLSNNRNDNPINSADNYVSANAMFLNLVGRDFYNISYEKCLKIREEILREVMEDNGAQKYNL